MAEREAHVPQRLQASPILLAIFATNHKQIASSVEKLYRSQWELLGSNSCFQVQIANQAQQ
jgi:hypothetical protein